MGGSSSNTTNTSGGGKDKDSLAAFLEGDRVLAYHGPLLYEAKRTAAQGSDASCKRKKIAQRPQDSYPQQSAPLGNSSFNQSAAQPPRAPTPTPTPRSSGNMSGTPCSVEQPAVRNPVAHLRCFSCGEKGHFANRCPQKKFRLTCCAEDDKADLATHQLKELPGRSCHIKDDSAATPGEPLKVITCFHCGNTGHSADKCPQRKQGQRIKCFYCGNLGHYMNRCPQRNLEEPAKNVSATNLSLGNEELIKSPSKKQAVLAEVLLPDPEASLNACFECGKTGHVTQLCPPIRQDARGVCFTCGQYGHYCYTCPVPYCPYCEEHHQSEDCPMNQVACTRCGEKGHQVDQCHVNCPNCDEDHQPGECPMLEVTCFLCEGQDHCPKDCFLHPILTKAVELQRTSLQVAARLVVNKVGKDNQYQTPFILKGNSQIAPKCQNTSVEMKRSENVLRTHRPAGPAVRNPIARCRCFNCGKRGHISNKCPQQVTPKKYNLRATPARGQTSTASKSHQTSQASKAASTPSQSTLQLNIC